MPSDMTVPQEVQSVFSLPGFDEYLLDYNDRSAVLNAVHADKICPGGNGMFSSTMVIDGRVAGTWKRSIKKTEIEIVVAPFTILSKTEKKRFAEAANRYGAFHNLPVKIR